MALSYGFVYWFLRLVFVLKNCYFLIYMENVENPYVTSAAEDSAVNRSLFIRRTYMHVAGAILAFALLEAYFIQSGIANVIALALSKNYLIFMGVVIAGGFLTSFLAVKQSRPMQYAGLALQVVFYAAIFSVLIPYALAYDPKALQSAVLVTGGLTVGLTAIVFGTRKDFSFLGSIITMGFWILIALGLGSFIFKYELSTLLFAGLGACLAAGAILYSTSNILRNYPTDMHVGAAVSLFGSIMTLFWYILQLFLNRD